MTASIHPGGPGRPDAGAGENGGVAPTTAKMAAASGPHRAAELEQMNVDVRDNRDRKRYEIWTDGELAGFVQYRLHDGRITFVHTEIDPAHEGTGLGSQLARAALDDARARQLAVLPVCPFVADFIRRHPDRYLDLVVPSMRAEVTTAPGESGPGTPPGENGPGTPPVQHSPG